MKPDVAEDEDDVVAAPNSDDRDPKGFGPWMRHLFLEGPTLGEILRDAYLTFDRRTLGFTRILFGFLLITDLFRRTPDWMDMFASTGVLPSTVSLSKPTQVGVFTILHAFNTRPELTALWIAMLATFTCVLVGYKTKVAQVLTVIWVSGVDSRVLLIENGGYTVFNLLALWTAFLPMGDRFSVDAWIESMRRRRETTARALNDRSDVIPREKQGPHVSLLGLVLVVQIAAIYFFNVIHKWGPAWRREFSAVHYVLYVDRMVTPIVGKYRDKLPFWGSFAMTKFVIGAEAILPFCVLSPLAKRWARLTGVALILLLHVGIGTVFVLGPFAWALCVMATLFFCKEDWEDAYSAMRREHRARTVLFDPTSAGALLVARSLARLDGFELLTFKEAPALPTGIGVRGPGNARRGGGFAWAQIVDALPLGPLFAWLFRAPIVSSFLEIAIRICEVGIVARLFGIEHAAVRPAAPEPSRVSRGWQRTLAVLREIGIAVMFIAAVNQGLVELWSTRRRWYAFIADVNEWSWLKDRGIRASPQPEVMRALTLKLRFLQGWFMFSPNPIMEDGTIVVDAITVDGRHIDPFTREPPDFDLPSVKSYGYNQIWSDYKNRIAQPQFQIAREPLRRYLLRLHERTGRPEDEIVSGDVYWVRDLNPPYEDPRRKSFGFTQIKLFSFDGERVRSFVPPEGKAPGPIDE